MTRLYKLAKNCSSWMSFLDQVKRFPNWFLTTPDEKRMTKSDLLEFFNTVKGIKGVGV